MKTLLRRLVRIVRLGLAPVWAAFTAWLFTYAMPLSGLHALAGLWVLLPFPLAPERMGPRLRREAGIAVFALALLTVPLVGLPEFAAATNALHCRTLGFLAAAAPPDCDRAEDHEQAREPALFVRHGSPCHRPIAQADSVLADRTLGHSDRGARRGVQRPAEKAGS